MTTSPRPTAERRERALLTTGGPTVVLDVDGLRIVSDPTFDEPQGYDPLTKTAGPAVPVTSLGDVDVVLVSHDEHADNLDHAGREIALGAPLVLTTRSAAPRLGPAAHGLSPWSSYELSSGTTVTAVPAVHGPSDGERTPEGFVNCEVIGFVVTMKDGYVVYVSGDNASLAVVTEVHERFPRIDLAVLHAGAASVPAKFGGRPLSLTGARAAAAAEILGAEVVVAVHADGWAHFSEGVGAVTTAFATSGPSARLLPTVHGRWTDLDTLRGATQQ